MMEQGVRMNKKYEIGKEHPEEIRQAKKQTKDKREDQRLRAVELRILGYPNEEIVQSYLFTNCI